MPFLMMLLGLAAAALALYLAFRLLVGIGQAQGRKSYGDRSNAVGRMMTSVAGAVFRNRH